ncbi:MAG TPA: DUF4105 domain-containing protein [Flavisolibacter sp.]
MKKITGIFALLFLLISELRSQDTCTLRISLLTCSPGEELYSTFGHSALRVSDASNGMDVIFNYGTFQFGDDFYTKFIRGKLLYMVSIEDYKDFAAQYRYESRTIQEQVLQLTCAERQALFAALQENAKEENRYYRYDFLFDNCSTRLRDMIRKNTQDSVRFGNILPPKIPTFRNLLYTYLDNGAQHWSKFGIDLLLGSRLDRKVSNEEAMFLPDYLLKGIDRASKGGVKLAAPPQSILTMPSPLKGSSFFQPMVVFSLLLLLLIVASFVPNKKIQRGLAIFDFSLFFLLGLVGCLLIFMWTATDHALCKDNYNLLWALPTHAIAAFFLWRKGSLMQYYLLITIILQAILLIGWIFLPQQFNLAFLPIILIILLRCWLLITKPHMHDNSQTVSVPG